MTMLNYGELMFEALTEADLSSEFWLDTYKRYHPKRGGKVSAENARWCVLNKLGAELGQDFEEAIVK